MTLVSYGGLVADEKNRKKKGFRMQKCKKKVEGSKLILRNSRTSDVKFQPNMGLLLLSLSRISLLGLFYPWIESNYDLAFIFFSFSRKTTTL